MIDFYDLEIELDIEMLSNYLLGQEEEAFDSIA